MEVKPKILYVDNETTNTMLFQISFSERFEIMIADSGKKGLELLKVNPDIRFVISDMKMPKMNGMEFIQEVNKLNKALPCMLLSGYQQTQEIFDALRTQLIVAYEQKPFNKAEIEKLIDENI